MLIGGSGSRTLRLVARHADIWHSFGAPSTLAQRKRVLDRHCADIGRDPTEIVLAASLGGGPTPSVEPHEAGLALRELGTSSYTLGVNDPDYDLSGLRRWIAWRDESNDGQMILKLVKRIRR